MACLQRMRIPTASMEPTIPTGSRIVVESVATDKSSVARWDAVVFSAPAVERLSERLGTIRFPKDQEAQLRGAPAAAGQIGVVDAAATAYSQHHNVVRPHMFYVKRVVGLPGERLQVRGGQIHVNGQPLEVPDHLRQSYAALSEGPAAPLATQEVAVPEDAVYLLSDNLSVGQDSRHIGPVPLDFVVGRVARIEK